jgi:hypothetical protein
MNAGFPINAHPEPAKHRPIHVAGTGSILVLLRAEALLELVLAVWVYRHFGGVWPVFAALFLVPDLSMVGYFVNRRVGARVYNLGHTYMAPALLALLGFTLAAPLLYSLALIWAAHIGFDRVIGYGLKYPAAFVATHLGWKDARNLADDSKS